MVHRRLIGQIHQEEIMWGFPPPPHICHLLILIFSLRHTSILTTPSPLIHRGSSNGMSPLTTGFISCVHLGGRGNREHSEREFPPGGESPRLPVGRRRLPVLFLDWKLNLSSLKKMYSLKMTPSVPVRHWISSPKHVGLFYVVKYSMSQKAEKQRESSWVEERRCVC